MPKIDAPTVPHKDTATLVTIPALDIFDQKFPTIRISRHEFHAGETYSLEEPLASTVKERIRAWERSNIRLLQPKKDVDSERQTGQRSGLVRVSEES